MTWQSLNPECLAITAEFIAHEAAMEIVESSYTTLRTIGKDEAWLERWILEKPGRLGLGPLRIVKSQTVHYRNLGGRLDILGYSPELDTYYEIEIMLGECDADHGFRTLDYWARERLLKPNSKHVAVLVAEDLSGRYKTLIETLPQFLPLIGIEIKVLKLPYQEGIATIQTSIVSQPDDLILQAGDEPDVDGDGRESVRDRSWWEVNSNSVFMATVDEIVRFCTDDVGPARVDYSAQSYISLKKGRRCWLPMWPRSDGVYVYLPGGPEATVDAPSEFFQRVKAALEENHLSSPGWTYKYNGGANPISFAITRDRATHSVIKEILAESYQLA